MKFDAQILLGLLRSVLGDWRATFLELLKIGVPVIVVTKIAVEFGLINGLGYLLDPVMGLVGLPGSLGIVWATGMLTNLYTSMVVFASLAADMGLTEAQVTILCSMLLIAHSLPIELAITKKAGAGFGAVAFLRLFSAFFYGLILNFVCSSLHVWQGKAAIFFQAEASRLSLLEWSIDQIIFFSMIGLLILGILIVMRVLELLGILSFLERLLEPLLKVLGMSGKAAPVTVVGMVLGITYGGSLIIKETLSGRLEREDVFYSLALMGLCHAIIEDTLLMLAMGGKITGILWGRLLFSFFVIFLLVRLVISFTKTK